MTSTIRLIAVVGLVASCSYGFASGQAPVGAPAGATRREEHEDEQTSLPDGMGVVLVPGDEGYVEDVAA